MPTTLSQIAQYHAPVWEMFNRIEYHTGTGRVLDGLKFSRESIIQITGEEIYPLLRPITYTVEEQPWPGAPDLNITLNTKTTPIQPIVSVVFFLLTMRENGWMVYDPTSDPSTELDVMGGLELAPKVIDAIETQASATGKYDATFEGTTPQPPLWLISDSADVNDLSWTTKIECRIPMVPMCRGQRSSA